MHDSKKNMAAGDKLVFQQQRRRLCDIHWPNDINLPINGVPVVGNLQKSVNVVYLQMFSLVLGILLKICYCNQPPNHIHDIYDINLYAEQV